jgi:hypothetical protein
MDHQTSPLFSSEIIGFGCRPTFSAVYLRYIDIMNERWRAGESLSSVKTAALRAMEFLNERGPGVLGQEKYERELAGLNLWITEVIRERSER